MQRIGVVLAALAMLGMAAGLAGGAWAGASADPLTTPPQDKLARVGQCHLAWGWVLLGG